MSQTPGSRARYKHKRATKRFADGIRKQKVPALVVPPTGKPGKKK